MEKKSEVMEIAKEYFLRAASKLESAQLLLQNNFIDDAISRAYYAAFLASKGLLYLLGISPKSHSGTMTMMGLKVIKMGLLPASVGRALNKLFEARETSDYSVTFFYTTEDGKDFLRQAKEILDHIKKLMQDKFNIKFS